MKVDYEFLQGKVKWFRSQTPDPWGWYKHDLYLDGPSLEKWQRLKELGIKNELKRDDDGDYVTLRRPTEKKLRSGKTIGYNPPEVLDGSKPLPSGGFEPLRNVLVGNGSDITTKIEVYSYNVPVPPGQPKKTGKAIRWLSSRIDNLIPFEINRDFDENQEKLIKGLDDQPPQTPPF